MTGVKLIFGAKLQNQFTQSNFKVSAWAHNLHNQFLKRKEQSKSKFQINLFSGSHLNNLIYWSCLTLSVSLLPIYTISSSIYDSSHKTWPDWVRETIVKIIISTAFKSRRLMQFSPIGHQSKTFTVRDWNGDFIQIQIGNEMLILFVFVPFHDEWMWNGVKPKPKLPRIKAN